MIGEVIRLPYMEMVATPHPKGGYALQIVRSGILHNSVQISKFTLDWLEKKDKLIGDLVKKVEELKTNE